MTDEEANALKSWRYRHLVKDEWDTEAATGRFSVQVENVVEELQERKDLEAPFSIEADIRIVSVEEE